MNRPISTQIPPSDAELHAYADGQLTRDRCREIEACLASRPELAARIAKWRHDANSLRAVLAGPLVPAAPRLDPVAVRRTMRTRLHRRLALCASLVVALGIGGLSGWQARSVSFAAANPPMEDAIEAYRIFATDRVRPVELDASNAKDLQAWMSARLGRPLSLPDLDSYGFKLLGGRLLSTAEGPAALLMYQDDRGQRIGFYVRPSTRFPDRLSGTRGQDGLVLSYWYRNGYGFALVGRADDPNARELQQAVRSAT